MQKLSNGLSESQIDLTQASNFTNIRIVDVTTDSKKKGDPDEFDYLLLQPKSFSKTLTDLGFSEGDRAVKMVADIFSINPGANVYFYSKDLSDAADTISLMYSGISAANNVDIHFDLTTATTKADILDHFNVFKVEKNSIRLYYNVASSADKIGVDEAQTIRDAIGAGGALFCDGTLVQNTEAKFAAFATLGFPNSTNLAKMELMGSVANDLHQIEEDQLLGNQRGGIDGTGNGGINTIATEANAKKDILLWGTLCNGDYISVEYLKKWLDYNMPLIASSYQIAMANARVDISNDPDGAAAIESVLMTKVLKVAADNGALLNDNGDPLNLDYVDSSTGERNRTSVEATFVGTELTLHYNLAIPTPLGLVSIKNVIKAGAVNGK